jgi:hypothetical protein
MTELFLDQRKIDIAARINVEADRIKIVQLQLNVLRNQGILVDLSVSGTGMFTRTATWAEIGIQADEADPRFTRFSRGQKYLIPEEQIKRLRSIETRMRQWLDRLSYDVTGFRPYRWLPFTAYDAWIDRWNECKAELECVKSNILSHYDQYVEELAEGFQAVAHASWKSIVAQGYDWAIIVGKPFQEQEFVDHVVAEALSKMPGKAKIEQELKADYITALVFGQEDIAEDQARAAAIQQQAEIERQAKWETTRVEKLQSTLLEEHYAHQRKMNQLEETERGEKIEAMRVAEAEHARLQLRQIASPFQEVFQALRSQLAKDAKEMLESIKKNGTVRGKVAERGRGLIELFDLLAVQDDYELRGRLEALKQAIGPIGDEKTGNEPERDANQVVRHLQEISELEHQAVIDLMAGPSRFGMIEL